MNTNTKTLSPVQQAVQIVQDLVVTGTNGAAYESKVAEVHALMADFAMGECRAAGMPHELTLEQVTGEDMESSPEAEAYWRQTSVFFRRVFQAAAAAA